MPRKGNVRFRTFCIMNRRLNVRGEVKARSRSRSESESEQGEQVACIITRSQVIYPWPG